MTAAAQTERINTLMQLAGSTMTALEPFGKQGPAPMFDSAHFDTQAPSTSRTLGLGLNLHPNSGVGHSTAHTHAGLDPLGPMMSSFGAMSFSDRRASVDHAFGRAAPVRGGLRTRPSDAALRSSGAGVGRVVRGSDAGLGRLSDAGFGSRVSEAFPTRSLEAFSARVSDAFPTRAAESGFNPLGSDARRPSDPGLRTSDATLDASALTFGLGRRVSVASIWATGDGQTSQGLWPTYPLKI